MLAVSPLPSTASSQTDRTWRQSLFGRRRSLPQVKATFSCRKSHRSSVGEEDTLCSHKFSDPTDFVITDDYDFCSSFSVIEVVPENQELPLGEDQLVVSTRVKQPLIDTQLHRPKNPEVSECVCV